MRVWCVGGGAVGGVVAARLQRSGAEPFVIDTNHEHVMLLRTAGLHIGGLEDGTTTVLSAGSIDDAPSDPDAVLLAVRSSATAAAGAALVPPIGAGAGIVSLP